MEDVIIGDTLHGVRDELERNGIQVAAETATRDGQPLLRARAGTTLIELLGDPVSQVSVMLPVDAAGAGVVINVLTRGAIPDADAGDMLRWVTYELSRWSHNHLSRGRYAPLDAEHTSGSYTGRLVSVLPLITYSLKLSPEVR